MAKADKKLSAKRERRERRFFPRPMASPPVVYALGGVGALLLGAGAWAQWLRVVVTNAEASAPYGTWVLAAGIVTMGVAIWFGTSGEPTLRVGDAGVAVEKGGVTRMPWHAVQSVTYDAASGSMVVKGQEEGGTELIVRARVASHPQAAAWIAFEARTRIPAVTSFGADAPLPARSETAGEILALDPVQVVGKRCATSRTIIAFEPDARVCPRCERVYHKDHLPETCACGGTMNFGRGRSSSAPDSEATSDDAADASGEAAQESHA